MASVIITAGVMVVAWIFISRRRRAVMAALLVLAPVSPLLALRLALSLAVVFLDRLEAELPGAHRRRIAARVLMNRQEPAQSDRVVLDIEGHP